MPNLAELKKYLTNNMIDYSLLETKGFLVIRNYLDSTELETCQQDYKLVLANNKKFVNGNYKFLVTRNIRHLDEKIQNTLAEVRENTSLNVDIVAPAASYYDTNLINFEWHQDHDPYYLQQDSYHALNFWMPIIKDIPSQSGLAVVQFDKLPFRASKDLVGTGAKEFSCRPGHTEISDYTNAGTKWSIDMSLEDIAATPDISAGDLLLMRQDIIHRSQIGNTHRVALGVRCYNGESVLTKEEFNRGCFKKRNIIKNNPEMFKYVEQKFKEGFTDIKLKSVIDDMYKK